PLPRQPHPRYQAASPAALARCLPLNDADPPELDTLSLHDALPISAGRLGGARRCVIEYYGSDHRMVSPPPRTAPKSAAPSRVRRSEEHTSELQSREKLVCRLLLEKKHTDRR